MRRDRYVSVGLIISGVSGLLLLISDSFLVLFGVVFLLGLGQALSIAAQSALVAEHCQEEIRIYGHDAVYGVYRSSSASATRWGRCIASILVVFWGYQGAFVAISALVLLCGIAFTIATAARSCRKRPRSPRLHDRRALLLLALFAVATCFGDQTRKRRPRRPLRIYAITFRGMTDVERGFQDYFAARRIPVQITSAT
jgi:MFS family permease